MARPISEEKREAILLAAAELVAIQGISAPTLKIARAAGVAEGTLFTYFSSKDALLNALYLTIKSSLAHAILSDYPTKTALRDRVFHFWSRYIDWGASHPVQRQALRQLTVSDRISEQTRRIGRQPFEPFILMIETTLKKGVPKNLAPGFLGSFIEAAAELTLEFIAREPARAEAYKLGGFEIYWNGNAR